MTTPLESSEFVAPPAAAAEWLALTGALEATPGVACQVEPEEWWDKAHEEAAVAACRRCPVRRECAGYSLSAGEREGVWGALTPADRKGLRSAS